MPDHQDLETASPSTSPRLALTSPRIGVPAAGRLEFLVFRDGKPLGRHEIRFSERNGDLEAEISVDYAVKLGPVSLFRYKLRGREIWSDGRLAIGACANRQQWKAGLYEGRSRGGGADRRGQQGTPSASASRNFDRDALEHLSTRRPDDQSAKRLPDALLSEVDGPVEAHGCERLAQNRKALCAEREKPFGALV